MGCENSGVNGSSASAPLQLQYVPVTRVENACATGIETIRNAAHALAAGVYDLVLALVLFHGPEQPYQNPLVEGKSQHAADHEAYGDANEVVL